MAPDSARYTLAPEALRDIEGIWAYGAETWSPDQADRYLDERVQAFDRVARSPTLFRERLEFTPPVRIYPYRSHLIVYFGPEGAGDHLAHSRRTAGLAGHSARTGLRSEAPSLDKPCPALYA